MKVFSGTPTASDFSSYKVFEGLDEADLKPLAAKSQFIKTADGEVLLEEGEPTEAIYLIHEGAIAFFRDQGTGDQLLSQLGEKSFFGELGLFGLDKSVSVRSIGEGRLIEIGYRALEPFFEKFPSIHKRIENQATNMAVALELGRRQEVRIRIKQDIALELDDGTVMEVCLENLSPGGLCLTWVPPTWMVGEKVRFVLKFSHGILHLSGKVAWRYKKRVGIALERNLPNHTLVIQKTIRALLESAL